MKLLLIFSCLFFPISYSSPIDENRNTFLNDVERKYSHYTELINITTTHYDLLVIKGSFNAKPSYGICFTSINPGMYKLVIKVNESYYTLEHNSRKDSIGLALHANDEIEIIILDKEGNEVYLKEKKLKPFILNDFEGFSYGEGMGGEFTSLHHTKMTIPFLKLLTIISICVFGFCFIILLTFFLLKKGMFNSDRRKLGVMNIKEILYSDELNHVVTEDDIWDGYVNNEVIKEKTNEIEDIKKYLSEKGFNTNYSELTEEERNQIMLELIKLKDDLLISVNLYYKESSELWKK